MKTFEELFEEAKEHGKGFKIGWDARQEEIDELKAEIKELKDEINDDHSGFRSGEWDLEDLENEILNG